MKNWVENGPKIGSLLRWHYSCVARKAKQPKAGRQGRIHHFIFSHYHFKKTHKKKQQNLIASHRLKRPNHRYPIQIKAFPSFHHCSINAPLVPSRCQCEKSWAVDFLITTEAALRELALAGQGRPGFLWHLKPQTAPAETAQPL